MPGAGVPVERSERNTLMMLFTEGDLRDGTLYVCSAIWSYPQDQEKKKYGSGDYFTETKIYAFSDTDTNLREKKKIEFFRTALAR